MTIQAAAVDPTELRLLDEFQRDLPLELRPYAAIAQRLGLSEEALLATLHRAGWSTLAAMQVPEEMLEAVAEFVSAFPEVNHNYQREHRLNLWFVVAAASDWRVAQVLREIEYRTSLPVLDLPLEEAFRLDLGFRLS